MRWLWLAGAVILIAAAAGVFWATQRPDFVVGLVAASVASLGRAVWPLIKDVRLVRRTKAQKADYKRRLREADTGKEGGR